MLSKNIYIEGSDLYISKKFLTEFISIKAVEKWNNNQDIIKEKFNDAIYYLHSSIPQRTKNKLPGVKKLKALEHKEDKANDIRELSELIKHAFYYGYTKNQHIYQSQNIQSNQVVKFSRLHSVIDCILTHKNNCNIRDLKTIHSLFNNFFPGKFNSKHSFCNALRKAKADGIISVALDKRVFGNNNEQTNKKLNEVTQYWTACLISHPRKLSNPQVHQRIKISCDTKGYPCPSLSWVKKYRQKLLANVVAFQSRYGHSETNKKLPFASLNHAKHANDQWQMDGWTLPFWYKGEKNFQRPVLVRLIDSNSKKIVGYSVGKTENTAVIMDAIRSAVNNTGCLPFEILTDNHAFNQTHEAKNLQSLLAKKGTRWEVTENPQHKSIVERYNQHLDALCKDHYYGYLGQGVRAKSIDALAKPEMIDQYLKNQLSFEEIHGYAVEIVESYNKKAFKNGLIPNEQYEQNRNPHPITVSIFDRAELMTMQTEKQIRRGQITFNKGVSKYEFQLPASLYADYNDKIVIVRYEDLREGIYLFDKKTGEPIDHLQLKDKINGAKVNQTVSDIELLNKHTGRLHGIKAKARKQLEDIRDKALQIDPDAHLIVNALTTPKNIMQELQEDSALRQAAQADGLELHKLHVPARENGNLPGALQPVKKQRDPFSANGHVIKPFNPEIGAEND